jgi:hypothetical protein
MTREQTRLEEARLRRARWNRWGPYLAERAWGTVREDYSADGEAWDYFTFEQSGLRAYRWNEDGLCGICDRHQRICFAIALWNGRDPILKERLFGLTGDQGNHGEDVKEQYFYLENTPTHSYMKCLYKYPQAEFPYQALLDENRRRTRLDPEYELLDTGVFNESRYFDVEVEYAKATPDDILIRITVSNRGPDAATIHILPTVWFRNRWSWGYHQERASLRQVGEGTIELDEPYYGLRYFYCNGTSGDQAPELLFAENENDNQELWGTPNASPYVKSGIGRYVVNGDHAAVNPEKRGTKASAYYTRSLDPGASALLELRLTDMVQTDPFGAAFARTFADRICETDEFYASVIPPQLSPGAGGVMRQAFAGMLWSKQFYHYVVRDWLNGDPATPTPPASRKLGRNHDWTHLFNADVISMPDTWEYPWYAAWDLSFHCLPLALIDPEFAKEQLVLLLREWYMHPNGKMPAYEWNFNDVNPPVHAWAAWRVYKIEAKRCGGSADRKFLVRIFHKLLLNFTWWVNRKDAEGKNVFQGGFLGLDNIGVFNRSEQLPGGGFVEQADGTGWMAMYSLNLMAIALELAQEDPAYEDVASKFWEHFLYIAAAINNLGGGSGMWHEADGFFYDVLRLPDGRSEPLKVRSMVGLIPLFAVETLEPLVVDQLPGFKRRMEWFIKNRPDLTHNVASMVVPGKGERKLLSMVDPNQLRRILTRMLDEDEFLSPFGIRSLSLAHRDQPYVFDGDGTEHTVGYEPGESTTGLFGGNSNWRGPVWFPMNYLLIESLQKFHHYLGEDYKVECPTRSGKTMTLWEVAAEISRRLSRLCLQDENGRRPSNGANDWFHSDPHWRDLVLFYEYFHPETGQGLGANHQTGWTGLIAKLLQQSGE